MERTNMSTVGDEGMKFQSECAFRSRLDNIHKYFVLFSDSRDTASISRIFCAMTTCMACCSLLPKSDWMVQNIVLTLVMEEDLLPKEKACVLFSLLSLNFSAVALEKFGNFVNGDSIQCLESFAAHIQGVMSDVDVRHLFVKYFYLDELLNLIDDFLTNGRVMVYTDAVSETMTDCCSKFIVLLDGINIRLSCEAASTAQLVAGSIILASICTATDHIGFVCDATYNVLRTWRYDFSLMLTILHVFAYLCGEQFFTLDSYKLFVMVLKSIVTFLETASLSDSAACRLTWRGHRSDFPTCIKCPFSVDAVSLDVVMSVLIDKLQRTALPVNTQHSLMGSISMSNPGFLSDEDRAKQSSSCEELSCAHDMNCNSSRSLNKFTVSATQANSVVDVTLLHFSDVLSLVEIIACNMSWDWTCRTVVPQLMKLLKSRLLGKGNFATAIIVLIGQLGRLGVDSGGYEDKGVGNLRSELSAFLCEDTTLRLGLPVQIATATALLRFVPLSFETIIQSDVKHSFIMNLPVAAALLRKWFSLLSKEQQSLSLSLLQSPMC